MDGAQDLEDRMKNAYDLLFLQWEYLYTIHFGERSLLIHHADTCRYVEQMYRHHIQVVGADFDTTIGQGFGEHSKDVLLQLHRSLPHSKRLAERLGQGEEVHSLTRPMIMICKDKVSRCAKLIQLQNLELVAEKCRDVHRRVKAFLKAHSNDIYPCQEMLDLEGAVKELESANAIKQLVPSSAHTTVVPIRDIAMPDSNEFYPDCVGSSKCSVM
ncbi:hypothetical protein H0H93_016429 [Arthromyces matolae]|nr:hypothetical protein H0H93_016429 [Arthromyces matolae]